MTGAFAKKRESAFGSFHPVLCFAFFAAAIILGMCLRHPVYLALGLVFSLCYYVVLRGRRAWRLVGMLAPLVAAITVINPLFNTLGTHVLFTWWGGRPYTLEALYAGASVGVMVAAMLFWFGCYNVIMTSDKFIYLFGRLAPSVSLVLSLVLRFVPNYQRKLREFTVAGSCIGRAGAASSFRARLRQSAVRLNALAGWALEDGIVAADSLRSRGYGLSGRTSFSLYRFDGRDALLLAVMAALAACVAAAIMGGTADVRYLPVFEVPDATPFGMFGYVAYALLLAIPSAIDIREAVQWRISLSRI